MAIYREVFRTAGSNSAQINANHDWATALRVRMTDAQMITYGPCNVLRLVNNSTEDITVSWTWDIDRTESITIKANSVFNLTVDDGKNFYGFDVYCAHATANISAGEILYKMSRVQQVRE